MTTTITTITTSRRRRCVARLASCARIQRIQFVLQHVSGGCMVLHNTHVALIGLVNLQAIELLLQ